MSHKLFKVTSATFKDGKFTSETKKSLSVFLNSGITPKSVGVEFLENVTEGTPNVVVSVGYLNKKSNKKTFGLTVKKVGKLDLSNLVSTEKALNKAADTLETVICHEFFVTNDSTVYAVFLTEETVTA